MNLKSAFGILCALAALATTIRADTIKISEFSGGGGASNVPGVRLHGAVSGRGMSGQAIQGEAPSPARQLRSGLLSVLPPPTPRRSVADPIWLEMSRRDPDLLEQPVRLARRPGTEPPTREMQELTGWQL